MSGRPTAAAFVLALLVLVLTPAGASAGDAVLDAARPGSIEPAATDWLDPVAEEGSIYLAGSRTAPTGTTPAGTQSGPLYDFLRKPRAFCGTLDAVARTAPCVDGAASGRVVRYCTDGTEALNPLYRREIDGVTGQFIGVWEPVDVGGCPEDVPVDPVVLTVEEFRRLPLASSVPQFQPAHGRGLVNMDLIVFTDPDAQVLATTVLGVPVAVRATPVQFAWDFGDGSAPLITADPGAPYPDYTIGHPFRQPGTCTVQLATTWAGEFQVNGVGPWFPVDGTASTTSLPLTTEVVEAHARLVAEGARP